MSCIDIDFQIVRSARRKTIGLQVKSGKVVVRAPNFVEESYIQQLIDDKSAWLKSKIHQQNTRITEQKSTLPLGEGSLIWVAGQRKVLSIIYEGKAPVRSTETHVIVSLPTRLKNHIDKQVAAIKKALEAWYKAVAHEYLPKRIERFSQQTELFYHDFQIKKYKARWGSCNSRKELSFNYFLMMLPAWVIDYVIIHELCHLKHLNHSRDFWLLVAKFCPSYVEAKKWLKQHQDQLSLS